MSFPRMRESSFSLAQMGERHRPMAKTLKGIGGGSVIELREDHDGGTYRAIYTIRYAQAVYMLHAVSEEIEIGREDAATRYQSDRTKAKGVDDGARASVRAG